MGSCLFRLQLLPQYGTVDTFSCNKLRTQTSRDSINKLVSNSELLSRLSPGMFPNGGKDLIYCVYFNKEKTLDLCTYLSVYFLMLF